MSPCGEERRALLGYGGHRPGRTITVAAHGGEDGEEVTPCVVCRQDWPCAAADPDAVSLGVPSPAVPPVDDPPPGGPILWTDSPDAA